MRVITMFEDGTIIKINRDKYIITGMSLDNDFTRSTPEQAAYVNLIIELSLAEVNPLKPSKKKKLTVRFGKDHPIMLARQLVGLEQFIKDTS